MDVVDPKFNAIVTIIKDGDVKDIESKKLGMLIDPMMVILKVNGISLLSYYLETIRSFRFAVVRKFIENGADVNFQDSRGRTPLHWLVGHVFDIWQDIKAPSFIS